MSTAAFVASLVEEQLNSSASVITSAALLETQMALLQAPASSDVIVEPTLAPSVTAHPNKSLRNKLGLPALSKRQLLLPGNLRVGVVGHRGALFEHLENTREGFLKCGEWGCNAVELDVFLLDDGTLIVFHGGGTDENPGDLTDYCFDMGGKMIGDLKSFEETQKLRFNPSHAEFGCSASAVVNAKIPKLRDVLEDLKKHAPNMEIKIELKGDGVTEPVLTLVDELDMVGQCSFSSFNHARIALVRKLHPERDVGSGEFVYRTGALFTDLPSDYIERAQSVEASEIQLRYDTISKQVVDKIHEAGFKSMGWLCGPMGMVKDTTETYLDVGNEDHSLYETLIETGIQQLCVNRPDVLIQTQQALELRLLQGATLALGQ